MSRPSISLAGLMLLIACFALGFVALHEGTIWWAIVLKSMACCALLASFVGVLSTRSEERIAWAGFALFGCGYFANAFLGSDPKLLDRLLQPMYDNPLCMFFVQDDNRLVVLDSCLTIVFGCIGAALSRFFYVRSRDKRRSNRI